MDLKFSFGASNPLPLASEGAGSASFGGPGAGVLELKISLQASEIVAEGLSGDGVSYARVQKPVTGEDPAALAAALRSVLARCGAELPEPLLGSVTAVVVSLGGFEAEVLRELGLVVTETSTSSSSVIQLSTVDESLQARTGISAGTPITAAGNG